MASLQSSRRDQLRLLRAWCELPVGTPLQERDRAVVLFALLLGARPGVVLKIGRDPDFLKLDGSTRFASASSKTRGLGWAGLLASRWLVLRNTSHLPVVDTVREVVDDVQRERVRPFVDPAAVFFPLFGALDPTERRDEAVFNHLKQFLQMFKGGIRGFIIVRNAINLRIPSKTS